MVSLVDTLETDKLAFFQFSALPSTDVLPYISKFPSYTEDMVCQIADQVLNLEPANIILYSGRSLGRTVQFKLAKTLTTLLLKS